MADENRNKVSTLTNDQIITERKLPRRSFLTAAGTLLAGGAAALVAGSRALAQDKKEGASDPDSKKGAKKTKTKKSSTKTKTKKSKKGAKASDPDKAKN
ncbi:MAG TPA: hypothetical protein VG028_21665 [Terriglobia bacterium]|nr:hypothetical protein [Terriglobia bacterium]